ncbi:MAG: response regulator [Ktedonobacterales bacterium]
MPRYTDSSALPPSSGSSDLPNIYVVNSDPDFLEMIGSLLEDVRVRIHLEQMRPNIAVTVDNLRSAKPDLLILDVIPYQQDARQLMERIAADGELRHLPIMLASTSAGVAEELANAFGDQVLEVLPKPFDLDDFYLKVSRILVGVRIP